MRPEVHHLVQPLQVNAWAATRRSNGVDLGDAFCAGTHQASASMREVEMIDEAAERRTPKILPPNLTIDWLRTHKLLATL